MVLSDSDDNFKPSKKPPQPTRKWTCIYIYTRIIIHLKNINCLFIYTATSEELFDSLVGNSSLQSQQKSLISSSGEDSPVKFTPPKKGNYIYIFRRLTRLIYSV